MSRTEILKSKLLENVSYLDAFTKSCGKLSRVAITLTEGPTDSNLSLFFNELAQCKSKTENNKEAQIVIQNLYESLLPYLGMLKLKEVTGQPAGVNCESEESFDDLKKQLHDLTGLEEVKSTVSDLIAYHRIQQLREQRGLKRPDKTLHLAFMGNPGTGKTTVARIIGRMYKQLGLLTKGHFIEVSRTDLIAGYQGQTALKVKEVINRAKGGVLFIDEAYSLTENDHSDSYGRECLTELTKALEDYRRDIVVIVAGYTDLMRAFFESNPGLKSRFNTFIEFSDYSADELISIFEKMCVADDYSPSVEAVDKLLGIIETDMTMHKENFANGRYIRNLYEKIVMNHSRRLNSLHDFSDDDLRRLTSADVL